MDNKMCICTKIQKVNISINYSILYLRRVLAVFLAVWGYPLGTRGRMQTPSDLCVHLHVDIQSHWKVKMLRWLPFCGLLSFTCLCIFLFCPQASSLVLPLGCILPFLPWPVASSASSSSSCLPLWNHHTQRLLPGQICGLSPLLSLERFLSMLD